VLDRVWVAVEMSQQHRCCGDTQVTQVLDDAKSHRSVLCVDTKGRTCPMVGLGGGREYLLFEDLQAVVAGTRLDHS
jgi:hypothetical protein